MKDIIGAYLIIDKGTGKFYVGSTRNVHERYQRHISQLRAGKHHNFELQSLWERARGFSLKVYPTDTREEAYLIEQDIIDRYLDSPLMVNIGMKVLGGDNLSRNKNKEDIVSRIKKTLLEKMSTLTAEDRRLLYGRPGKLNGMWGRTHTDEVKIKLSKINLGNKYRLGKKVSDEAKKKMSEHAKQRVGKLNPFFGKKHSEETKLRLSELKKSMNMVPTNARKVLVDSVCYDSVTAAGAALGVSKDLIRHRIKSHLSKYSGYSYAN